MLLNSGGAAAACIYLVYSYSSANPYVRLSYLVRAVAAAREREIVCRDIINCIAERGIMGYKWCCSTLTMSINQGNDHVTKRGKVI